MKALDEFVQSPYCLALLAAIGLTSVFATPSDHRMFQLLVWGGAFAFPLIAFAMLRKLPGKAAMVRYPGFATAAVFFVEACGIYRWHPNAMQPDAFIGTSGLYVLFAVLTFAP